MLTSSLKRAVLFTGIAGICATGAFVALRHEQSRFDTPTSEVSSYILNETERKALNDTVLLTITEDANVLTLTKAQDNIWRIVEKSDYPAEPSAVRALLLALSQAERIEKKTNDPERYTSLGLDSSNAVRIEGLNAAGVSLFSIESGHAPEQREGVYAKRADEAMTWLISRNINVSVSFDTWMDKHLFTISASDIAAVMFAPADSESYRLEPRDIGGISAWALTDVPAGYSVSDQEKLRDVISSPAMVLIKDVASENDKQLLFSDHYLGSATYTLSDGATIRIDVAKEPSESPDNEKNNLPGLAWLSFTVTPPDPETKETEKDAGPAEKPKISMDTFKDYGMMQEAANSRVFSIDIDVATNILRPRSDFLIAKKDINATHNVDNISPLPED